MFGNRKLRIESKSILSRCPLAMKTTGLVSVPLNSLVNGGPQRADNICWCTLHSIGLGGRSIQCASTHLLLNPGALSHNSIGIAIRHSWSNHGDWRPADRYCTIEIYFILYDLFELRVYRTKRGASNDSGVTIWHMGPLTNSLTRVYTDDKDKV